MLDCNSWALHTLQAYTMEHEPALMFYVHCRPWTPLWMSAKLQQMKNSKRERKRERMLMHADNKNMSLSCSRFEMTLIICRLCIVSS